MAELILAPAEFPVKIIPLATNCPKFVNVKLLLYQVQSAVSAEAFQVFVSTFEGAPPAITTKNKNDLLLLSEEFGFASLHFQVTSFISEHRGADDEAGKVVNDITEENLQIKEALFPLRGALSGLRIANLQMAALQEASLRLSEENRTLRQQFAAAGQVRMKLEKGHDKKLPGSARSGRTCAPSLRRK
jgi:hypothetical protein